MWITSTVDVRKGQLIDVFPGKDAKSAARWLRNRLDGWRAGVQCAALDLSRAYQAAYKQVLPRAEQVADPFHVVGVANRRLTETHRRVQEETHGRRGRKQDDLYQARNLLTLAREKLDHNGKKRLRGLLDAGDPRGEVRLAWHAKETVRRIYQTPRPPRRRRVHPPARLGPATRILPPGAQPTRTHPTNLAPPDRRLAPSPGHQRVHRSGQQSHQTSETRRVRVPQLPQLPNQSPPLRRQTQLEPTPHPHSPLKPEEPVWLC